LLSGIPSLRDRAGDDDPGWRRFYVNLGGGPTHAPLRSWSGSTPANASGDCRDAVSSFSGYLRTYPFYRGVPNWLIAQDWGSATDDITYGTDLPTTNHGRNYYWSNETIVQPYHRWHKRN
jgi:hypothetical protein